MIGTTKKKVGKAFLEFIGGAENLRESLVFNLVYLDTRVDLLDMILHFKLVSVVDCTTGWNGTKLYKIKLTEEGVGISPVVIVMNDTYMFKVIQNVLFSEHKKMEGFQSRYLKHPYEVQFSRETRGTFENWQTQGFITHLSYKPVTKTNSYLSDWYTYKFHLTEKFELFWTMIDL